MLNLKKKKDAEAREFWGVAHAWQQLAHTWDRQRMVGGPHIYPLACKGCVHLSDYTVLCPL